MTTEEQIATAAKQLDDAVKELCALLDMHAELALSFTEMGGRIYYKAFHPPTCPEGAPALPKHEDVPDVFKQLFSDTPKVADEGGS